MSSISNKKSANWRQSCLSSLTTIMTTPKAQRILCDQAVLSNLASQMRRLAISALALA